MSVCSWTAVRAVRRPSKSSTELGSRPNFSLNSSTTENGEKTHYTKSLWQSKTKHWTVNFGEIALDKYCSRLPVSCLLDASLSLLLQSYRLFTFRERVQPCMFSFAFKGRQLFTPQPWMAMDAVVLPLKNGSNRRCTGQRHNSCRNETVTKKTGVHGCHSCFQPHGQNSTPLLCLHDDSWENVAFGQSMKHTLRSKGNSESKKKTFQSCSIRSKCPLFTSTKTTFSFKQEKSSNIWSLVTKSTRMQHTLHYRTFGFKARGKR